jgi:hypothetical protein
MDPSTVSWWVKFVADWRDSVEFVYSIAGIMMFAGVILAYRTYRSTVVAARQRNTLDKISSYRNPETELKLHRAIHLIRGEPLVGSGDIAALPHADQQAIVFLLNEWDELSLYIYHRVLDETLLYNQYGPLAVEMWKLVRPVVLKYRETKPKSWLAFDWLAIRWMIKIDRVEHPRRVELLKEAQAKIDKALRH